MPDNTVECQYILVQEYVILDSTRQQQLQIEEDLEISYPSNWYIFMNINPKVSLMNMLSR